MKKEEIAKIREEVTERLRILLRESPVDFYLAVSDADDIDDAHLFYCGIYKRFGIAQEETAKLFPELADYIEDEEDE